MGFACKATDGFCVQSNWRVLHNMGVKLMGFAGKSWQVGYVGSNCAERVICQWKMGLLFFCFISCFCHKTGMEMGVYLPLDDGFCVQKMSDKWLFRIRCEWRWVYIHQEMWLISSTNILWLIPIILMFNVMHRRVSVWLFFVWIFLF